MGGASLSISFSDIVLLADFLVIYINILRPLLGAAPMFRQMKKKDIIVDITVQNIETSKPQYWQIFVSIFAQIVRDLVVDMLSRYIGTHRANDVSNIQKNRYSGTDLYPYVDITVQKNVHRYEFVPLYLQSYINCRHTGSYLYIDKLLFRRYEFDDMSI